MRHTQTPQPSVRPSSPEDYRIAQDNLAKLVKARQEGCPEASDELLKAMYQIEATPPSAEGRLIDPIRGKSPLSNVSSTESGEEVTTAESQSRDLVQRTRGA